MISINKVICFCHVRCLHLNINILSLVLSFGRKILRITRRCETMNPKSKTGFQNLQLYGWIKWDKLLYLVWRGLNKKNNIWQDFWKNQKITTKTKFFFLHKLPYKQEEIFYNDNRKFTYTNVSIIWVTRLALEWVVVSELHDTAHYAIWLLFTIDLTVTKNFSKKHKSVLQSSVWLSKKWWETEKNNLIKNTDYTTMFLYKF